MYNYEISLVPDIKAEYLKKRRMQAWVILICIAAGIACAAVILVFLGIVGAQAITISDKDNEIKCRVDGTGKSCKNYGSPIKTTESLSELLTIQDQMLNLDTINQSKLKASRIFGVLDVALIDNNDYSISVDELSVEFADSANMKFEAFAKSRNHIGFDAVEAFEKNTHKMRYDYGHYMRYDKESGDYVEIPSFCITELSENGLNYGVYHKNAAGCEAPMVKVEDGEDAPELMDEEARKEYEALKGVKDVEDIKIRRTYLSSEDLESYKKGDDKFKKEGDADVKGYYFESQCNIYGDDGKIDETASLEKCPVLDPEYGDTAILLGASRYEKGEENGGTPGVKFSVDMIVSLDVFKAQNRHLMIMGPARQNVTDSYVQVRDMFNEIKSSEDE